MKSLILLGKGPSISKLSFEFIDSHEKISWCNIHNDRASDIIPPRVNYLYLHTDEFITDLPKETQEYLVNKDIDKIVSTGITYKSVLGKEVDLSIINKKIFNFNASTGLLAFHHTCAIIKPENITIAGFDLFEPNTKMYYNSLDDSLSSNKNNESLNKLTENGIIKLKEGFHSPSKTIIQMDKIIKENKNIIFTIISNNKELNNVLNENENVHLW